MTANANTTYSSSLENSHDKVNKLMDDEQIIDKDINSQLRQHFLIHNKKVLFIINPASGSGRAINVFEKKVVPVLKQNQIQFEVVVTTRQGSAYKWLKNISQEDLFKWSGIVVVSGDGLLFEVFNSIMNRADWKSAIKLPIGIIPGGSGNGLSYSISHAVGDTDHNQIVAAAHNIISGKHSPLDLIRVICDKKTYYAFLSVGWGLLSDIDIESESLRLLLGGHRFAVYAVVRALSLRKYCGKLKFKLLPGYSRVINGINDQNFNSRPSSVNSDIQFNENDQVKLINYIIRKEERGFLTSNKTQLEDDTLIDEIRRILDENDEEKSNRNLNSKFKVDSSNNSLDSSSNGTNSEDENRNDDNNNQKTVTSIVDNGIQNGLIESEYKRQNLNDNQSNGMQGDWVTVKGDFVMVYATSTSHISSDCHFAPGAKLDDGIIWLLFLKGDIGRKDVVKFLLSLEKGSHVRLPYVHLVPVSEFVLESYSPRSKFTVDGELVNTSKVHCEMMPCVARVMTK